MNVQLLTQFILEVCLLIAQLMIPKPLGVENLVIFAIRAAVSEIQLILALNGKLALIGY